MVEYNPQFTEEEKEYIFKNFRTLIFNLADCIGLLKYYEEPDSKRDIVKETLERDLEYLMKLDDFIKEKFNRGEREDEETNFFPTDDVSSVFGKFPNK